MFPNHAEFCRFPYSRGFDGSRRWRKREGRRDRYAASRAKRKGAAIHTKRYPAQLVRPVYSLSCAAPYRNARLARSVRPTALHFVDVPSGRRLNGAIVCARRQASQLPPTHSGTGEQCQSGVCIWIGICLRQRCSRAASWPNRDGRSLTHFFFRSQCSPP